MKKKFTFIAIITAAVFIAACNPLIQTDLETSSVTIDTGIDLPEAGSKAVPTGIVSFRLTITAAGMITIEKTFTTASLSLDVNAGTARTFNLQAMDTNGNVLYTGTATKDLDAGAAVSVAVTMGASGFYVTFDTNGGTAVASVFATADSFITAPAAPTKAGFTFAGWYSDAGLTTPWVFASGKVTAGMTLYAKWTQITHTVYFEPNGGTPDPADQAVAEGALVTEPGAPTLSGFTFCGWFEDDGTFLNPWEFSTETVTADITLYARWLSPGLNFIQTETLGSTVPNAAWNWSRYDDTVNSNSYMIVPNSSAKYYVIEVTDGVELVFTSIQFYDIGNWSTATINLYAYADGVQIGVETYSGDVPYANGGYKHTFIDSAFSTADMIVIQPLQSDGTSPTPICIDDVVTGLYGSLDFESTSGLSGINTPTVNYTP